MGLKLYNQTRLPDDLLRRLLVRTARRIGARSGIVVKVTRARYHITGWVRAASAVRGRWAHRIKKGDGRWIKTDEAYMGLSLLDYRECDDHAIASADRIVSLMLHEWAHVRDHQQYEVFARRGPGGRRLAWRDRPEEVRAQFAAKYAGDKPSQIDDDLELELAEALRKTTR